MCTPLQCFSSVVGPNGSGKSNVIDAMLFVFGKRAKQVAFQSASFLAQIPILFHSPQAQAMTEWKTCWQMSEYDGI